MWSSTITLPAHIQYTSVCACVCLQASTSVAARKRQLSERIHAHFCEEHTHSIWNLLTGLMNIVWLVLLFSSFPLHATTIICRFSVVGDKVQFKKLPQAVFNDVNFSKLLSFCDFWMKTSLMYMSWYIICCTFREQRVQSWTWVSERSLKISSIHQMEPANHWF